MGEAEGAVRPHPFVDEIDGEHLAQAQLDALVQPLLRDVEHEEPAGDRRENDELVQEFG